MRPKFSAGTSQFITTCEEIACTSRQQRCTGLSSSRPLEPLILIKEVHRAAQHAHGENKIAPEQGPRLHRHAGVIMPCGGKRAPRQQFRRVDLRRDLSDGELHRHMLGNGELRVGQITLTRPLHELRVAPAREAQRRAEQRVGMHRDERRAVDRIAVDLRARRAGIAQRAKRHAAVLGDEHIVERTGVRSAAAQPGAIPGIELL